MSRSIFIYHRLEEVSWRKRRKNQHTLTHVDLIYAPRGQCAREGRCKRETVSARRLKYISESNDTAPKIAAWGPENGACTCSRRCFATRGCAEKERVPGIFRGMTLRPTRAPPPEEIKMGALIPKTFVRHSFAEILSYYTGFCVKECVCNQVYIQRTNFPAEVH